MTVRSAGFTAKAALADAEPEARFDDRDVVAL